MTETFTQTSNDPYIRHDYKIVFTDKTYKIFDNYEDVQLLWWNHTGNFLNHIEVLDKKQNKGFK